MFRCVGEDSDAETLLGKKTGAALIVEDCRSQYKMQAVFEYQDQFLACEAKECAYQIIDF